MQLRSKQLFLTLIMTIFGFGQLVNAMEAPEIIMTYNLQKVVRQQNMFFDSENPDKLWVLGNRSCRDYLSLVVPKKKVIEKTLKFDDLRTSDGIKEDKDGNIIRLYKGGFQIIDKNLKTLKNTNEGFNPDSLGDRITPDGTYAIIRWSKEKLEKWHIATPKLERIFSPNVFRLCDLALGNKEKMIVVTRDRVDEYTLNDVLIHNFVKKFPHKIISCAYCLKSNDKILGRNDNSMELYDEKNRFKKIIATECVPKAIKFCFEGKYIGFTDKKDSFYIRNINQDESSVLQTKAKNCWSIEWSPSNLIAVGADKGVTFFDVSRLVAKDLAKSGITGMLLKILSFGKFYDLEILHKN